MRASDLLGRTVYHPDAEPAGRIVDLIAHPDNDGNLFVSAAILTTGRRGRLLGYERPGMGGPWPIRKLAQWLHRHMHQVELRHLRLRPDPHATALPAALNHQRPD
jgi:hypothetical protein